jgi:pyridoxal/pyridoxine/pyridoxamine kinase
MFTSQRTYNSSGKKSDGAGFVDEQYILYAPLIPGRFTGTGDICAALFLAWTANASDDSYSLKFALEKLGGKNTYPVLRLGMKSSCSIRNLQSFLKGTMHAIVKRTAEYAEMTAPESSLASNVFAHEMRLIQSQSDIRCPPKLFNAVKVAPI